jgi:hypothetical protein
MGLESRIHIAMTSFMQRLNQGDRKEEDAEWH